MRPSAFVDMAAKVMQLLVHGACEDVSSNEAISGCGKGNTRAISVCDRPVNIAAVSVCEKGNEAATSAKRLGKLVEGLALVSFQNYWSCTIRESR